MYGTVLFDLDGTLTDPGEGITNSVAYALERYGICVEDRRELNCFIGPPLVQAFVEYYGFTEETAREAVEVYREYFSDRGIFENAVYPGVEEMLRALTGADKRLIVATSKPQVFAERILRHFGLAGYFEFIAGSELDGSRCQKAEVIEYALDMCRVTDRSGVIMVGDRKHDMIGAAACGIDGLGVLYGYGSLRELEDAGARFVVDTPAGVGEICIGAGCTE